MECRLRAWRMEDAPELARLLNNRAILDNLRDGIPYPYTESDAGAFLRGILAADPDQTFAYAVEAGGGLAGSIAVFRQDNIHSRTGELGYYIAQPLWGQGVGTFAVGEICRRLFARTDLLRIVAEPFARNAASCRVLEKNGFALEGVLRQNAVKNGAILDMKLYARLRDGSGTDG